MKHHKNVSWRGLRSAFHDPLPVHTHTHAVRFSLPVLAWANLEPLICLKGKDKVWQSILGCFSMFLNSKPAAVTFNTPPCNDLQLNTDPIMMSSVQSMTTAHVMRAQWQHQLISFHCFHSPKQKMWLDCLPAHQHQAQTSWCEHCSFVLVMSFGARVCAVVIWAGAKRSMILTSPATGSGNDFEELSGCPVCDFVGSDLQTVGRQTD